MSHHTVIWTSADGQSTIDMSGDYPTDDHDALRRMVREALHDQCADGEQKTAISAGSISVEGTA